ncbi:hypothetical protein BV25DRAFT_1858227 [Artomyces pyxidatus]|uniref:Uncharacterized protein n=1 Tax=Artomyces pyxidatus TaxID=48021 RepID=A0ACB8SX54_9AGAM|nr:hypothetical protein BV25DRAFT_1858227 [Artomyces pyxidatus]
MSSHSDTDSQSITPEPPLEHLLQTDYTPALGAYVVFTLDAIATLEALNDPIAKEQAQALPHRPYVGCVVQDWDLASPHRRYFKSACVFLSRGLPEASEAKSVEESMCVPITPAQHLSGRRAVTPSKPLPWDNLYFHTLSSVDLRLKPKPGDYSTGPFLSMDDVFYLSEVFDSDITRCKCLRRAYATAHPSLQSLHQSLPSTDIVLEYPPYIPVITPSSQPRASVASPAFVQPLELPQAPAFVEITYESNADAEANDPLSGDVGPDIKTQVDSNAKHETQMPSPSTTEVSELSSVGDRSASAATPHYEEDDNLDDVYMMMTENALGFEDPRDLFVPVADFSIDLSSVTEFCDARQLHEDLAAIKKIRLESEKRTREEIRRRERERMQNWAQDVEPLPTVIIDGSDEEPDGQLDVLDDLPREVTSGGKTTKLNRIWPFAKMCYASLKKPSAVLKGRRSSLQPAAPQRKLCAHLVSRILCIFFISSLVTISRLLSMCTLGCLPQSNDDSDCRSHSATEKGEGLPPSTSIVPSPTKRPSRGFVSRFAWPSSLRCR